MSDEAEVSDWVAREDGARLGALSIDQDTEHGLTARQRQVALLLALGYTCREVGERVGCSLKTADTHRGMILRKLGLRSNVDLARHAIRRGWVGV